TRVTRTGNLSFTTTGRVVHKAAGRTPRDRRGLHRGFERALVGRQDIHSERSARHAIEEGVVPHEVIEGAAGAIYVAEHNRPARTRSGRQATHRHPSTGCRAAKLRTADSETLRYRADRNLRAIARRLTGTPASTR